jgi:hypothetical protein|eukprot:COSAG01_NODE_1771_length_9270_cov_5.316868_2_plen_72_part_00
MCCQMFLAVFMKLTFCSSPHDLLCSLVSSRPRSRPNPQLSIATPRGRLLHRNAFNMKRITKYYIICRANTC